MTGRMSRRLFLTAVPASVVAVAAAFRSSAPVPASATLLGRAGLQHPDPRPGVDGSRVLTAADLANAPHVVSLFEEVRQIPHIVDGIRCYCGCADLEGYRSLLACYEGAGMAQWCEICQGEGRLAVGRAAEGQTLDQIRRAIDARYASG